jgi:hypothetical protein
VTPRSERRRRARGYTPPPDEGLIVTNRYGRPVQRSDFNEKFRAAVRLAGLPEKTRYHDLKHFYTSQLGASGRHDPKTVQALSQHAEFSETWDTCAHPPLAVEGVRVTVFGQAFREAGPPERRLAPDWPRGGPRASGEALDQGWAGEDGRAGLYAGFCTPGPCGRRGGGHPSRTGVATGL